MDMVRIVEGAIAEAKGWVIGHVVVLIALLFLLLIFSVSLPFIVGLLLQPLFLAVCLLIGFFFNLRGTMTFIWAGIMAFAVEFIIVYQRMQQSVLCTAQFGDIPILSGFLKFLSNTACGVEQGATFLFGDLTQVLLPAFFAGFFIIFIAQLIKIQVKGE